MCRFFHLNSTYHSAIFPQKNFLWTNCCCCCSSSSSPFFLTQTRSCSTNSQTETLLWMMMMRSSSTLCKEPYSRLLIIYAFDDIYNNEDSQPNNGDFFQPLCIASRVIIPLPFLNPAEQIGSQSSGVDSTHEKQAQTLNPNPEQIEIETKTLTISQHKNSENIHKM